MPCASDRAATEVPTRVRDALTELHAYVLILDGELQRVERHVATLAGASERTSELEELRRRRTVLAAQLDLLSRTIVALRAAADPAGRLL